MDPMFLPTVEQHDDPGPRGGIIRQIEAVRMPVPQIMHLFAFKTDRTAHLERFTQGVMRGPSPLSPGQRELIAAFTSYRNSCPFWIGSHAAVAAELLGDADLVDAVLKDFRSAPISDREKALFAFLEKVNRASNQITQADVDAVKAAGWTDEAVYDAITVCALFNFYNVWVDATGVHDLPAAAYTASGQRLATQGYVVE